MRLSAFLGAILLILNSPNRCAYLTWAGGYPVGGALERFRLLRATS